MKDLFVSVIIPNFNNQDRLALCLAALQEQTFPRHQTEIIVVDNGSNDQSIQIIKQFPVRLLIRPEFQSPYWCRNAGIREAHGPIIVLLDSNCVPVPEWLESGVKRLLTTDAGIVTGPVRFNFSSKKTLSERIDYLYSVFTPEDVAESSALPATHLFIQRIVFDHIGLFIPHIRSLGDIEWTQRAKSEGYAFGFSENAMVDYPAKTFAKAIKKMIRLGGGQKELWLAKGKSVWHPRWLLQIGKNLLPPSPDFYREMTRRNKAEKMGITPLSLFLGLYAIKLCYAWGMTFKRAAVLKTDNL